MKVYSDVGIIGAGPGGLQAALYTTRRNIDTIIFGHINSSSIYNADLENLCCVDFANGKDLLESTKNKVEKIGATFTNSEVVNLSKVDDYIHIVDSNKDEYVFKTILFATGVSHKKLSVPGEKQYLGRGVSTCVECDANFFRNRITVVVGSQSAAIDGVEILSRLSSKVILVTQEDEIEEKVLQQIAGLENVEIITSKIKEIKGDGMKVTGVTLNSDEELEVNGVFVELGAKGVIELTKNLELELDDQFKHLIINDKCETTVKNVFAAGDITGIPYQVSKTIGQAGIAGIEMGKVVNNFSIEDRA